MHRIHIRKRFLLTMLCTILLTLLSAPLYSNHLISGLWQSRYGNKTARIDITNTKNNANIVKITEFKAPSHKRVNFPQWCANKNGNCASMNTTIASFWRDFKIKFKVVGDGKITLNLRGPDMRDDGVRYPVMVDYRFAYVNGKQILKGRKSFWHDKSLQYAFEAKDGQVVELKFQARKHHLRWSDSQYYAINWLLFLSVSILSFLLSYKLVQYVSKFKLSEHNSRIDIVFVVVFFALLFVPMSHISSADKSMQENRMLAQYPHMFEKTLNLNYGKQFEQWYNDRFLGRESAIDIYSTITRKINNIYENGRALWIKSNNWMFHKGELQQKELSNEEILEIANQVNKLNEFCLENNIKMYMLIVPSKESIYCEFLPKDYQKIMVNNKINDYVNNLIRHFKVPTVYPYEELRQASQKDFVFFKQTHHWSDWGAYNGYLALMELIKKDYPLIHISKLDEYKKTTSKLIREDWDRRYSIGQTTGILRINKDHAYKKILKDEYKYYNHKNEIKPIITDSNLKREKYFKNPQQADALRVFLTGTSMNEDFLQFLPYSFSELKYYRLNNVKKVRKEKVFNLLKRYKKDILDYKPDILILCITVGNLSQLVNLTKD
ncbi:MAG: hypothetical protein IJ218_03375 [Alphaproteobacteria bacterium]|nr:hypothetical protein [Alphaproteobacteria bacterium]